MAANPKRHLIKHRQDGQRLVAWAETTKYPPDVAENTLAHRLPDAVERAYQRGLQFTTRTALMDDWSVYCGTAPTDAVVKPTRGVAIPYPFGFSR
ncbi:MAG: hypothetical protein P8J79_03465 [Halioglobus sp.]|nr:hypothetical protein [Halioglobus sp.]